MDGCNYDFVATTSIAGSSVRIERGFVGVDLTVGGSAYRVVNTHLEVREPDRIEPVLEIVQSAQAYQLILTATAAVPADRKLIVVGDINSDPRDPLLPVPPPLQPILQTDVIVPPYTQFIAATFTDAWTMRPGTATGKGAPLIGLSCCQLEDLVEPPFDAVRADRHDLPFASAEQVMDARLIGTTAASKTWPPGLGLWAADHAAVAAALQY